MRRALLVLMICGAVSACGGGSKGLSKQEYARRADAICAHYKREASAAVIPANTRQLAKAATRTLRALDTAIARLRPLRPPNEERQLANRWLASLSTLRFDVVQLRERARLNDLAGIHAVVLPAQRHNRASLRLAAQLGMKVCSTESG